jgi:hypothetical protein
MIRTRAGKVYFVFQVLQLLLRSSVLNEIPDKGCKLLGQIGIHFDVVLVLSAV